MYEKNSIPEALWPQPQIKIGKHYIVELNP
jgi:hypothetical protein